MRERFRFPVPEPNLPNGATLTMNPRGLFVDQVATRARHIHGDEWWVDGHPVSTDRGCLALSCWLRGVHRDAARSAANRASITDPFDIDTSHVGLRRGRARGWGDIHDGAYRAGDS